MIVNHTDLLTECTRLSGAAGLRPVVPGPLRWPKAASGLAGGPVTLTVPDSGQQYARARPGRTGRPCSGRPGAPAGTAFRWGRRVRRHARLREPPAKGRNVSLLSFFCEFSRAWGSIGPSSDFRTAARVRSGCESSTGLQSVVRVGCCLRVLAGAFGPGTGGA